MIIPRYEYVVKGYFGLSTEKNTGTLGQVLLARGDADVSGSACPLCVRCVSL